MGIYDTYDFGTGSFSSPSYMDFSSPSGYGSFLGTGFDLGTFDPVSGTFPTFLDQQFDWSNIGSYNSPMGGMGGIGSITESPWYSTLYQDLGGAKGIASLGMGGLSMLGNYLANKQAQDFAEKQLKAQTGLKQQELDILNNQDLAKTDALMRLVQERKGVRALDPRRYAEILASGQLPVEDIQPREGVAMAMGGQYRARGGLGLLRGRTGGQADAVNARLADGEYVLDADVVSALGDGNTEAGAEKLDKMREQVRQHKRSAPKGKIPPPAKDPMKYMKGK